MGRTAVEQAVLGDLTLLNSAQHRLFQAGGLCQICPQIEMHPH